ncbi:AI-2E family transporter [Psychromonas sp. 14N.309.X.WAT.B.A12]|jgi:AI-2 transport protein TqsA|uniref:AI-2E family transporter n=1 Tax=unclassified Psychromonas TaxID=2614957 RepID=UPI0025B00EFC|nr:AI-2E family transporter [Psychromonas sp. 14N.309.X.WAT.B.A12]MDN2664710.1 AI-2E family transporter [Psychromonas sp. 14N.309.X.WAT.B.A12]
MVNTSTAARTALYCSALVISLAGIKVAAPIVVPFLLSLFVAIICNPAINYLESKKLPRGLAITLVIATIFSLFIVLGGVIGAAVNDFRKAIPTYEAQLTEQVNWLVEWLAGHDIALSMDEVGSYFDPSKVMNLVTSTLSGFSSVLGNIFLLLLTVVFMLAEGKVFTKKLHMAFNDSAETDKKLDHFLKMVNQYMAIKTLVSLATGLIIGCVLWAIGVQFYVLWALLAFLLNYIPNIGSIISAVPAVILTFLQLGAGYASVVVGLFVSVNMIMGNLVEPRFMGRSLGLSTLVVFLSLIFWGWLLGMVGMLLSVPLTMILKIALESSEDGRWVAILLSSDEEVEVLENIDQDKIDAESQNTVSESLVNVTNKEEK